MQRKHIFLMIWTSCISQVVSKTPRNEHGHERWIWHHYLPSVRYFGEKNIKSLSMRRIALKYIDKKKRGVGRRISDNNSDACIQLYLQKPRPPLRKHNQFLEWALVLDFTTKLQELKYYKRRPNDNAARIYIERLKLCNTSLNSFFSHAVYSVERD